MHPLINQLIQIAIAEDIGEGDVTSAYFVRSVASATANIVAREPGVFSGEDVISAVLHAVDPILEFHQVAAEGDSFENGAVLGSIQGSARSILTADRTVLNFLQRMCGVAAQTRRYVDAVKPHPVRILDTRKTTPGWRLLEKQAVKAGGGTNHRMGLFDMVMVKDNHLLAEGAEQELAQAIQRVKSDHPGMAVELEADTLMQVKRFLDIEGVDRILLDNMSLDELREAVTLTAGRVELEASGGITLETIAEVASTGVDFISVGALTHSARALDLGLDFC